MKVSEYVGAREEKDINAQVDKILCELGNPEPPLSLPLVRELLKLDLSYYSSSDNSLLDVISHRLMVAGKQVAKRPSLLLDALKKLDLKALWVPDTQRILIDKDTPKLKLRWVESHEISHSIIPWHDSFMFGDNKQTLSPTCDEIIEAEANYSAGRLLFLGDRFSEEARDLELNFTSIKKLKTKFSNTMTSTLWRMVESRMPNQPVFGMISSHPNHPSIGKSEERFIRSNGFLKQFSNIQPEDIQAILIKYASHRKSGPIVDVENILCDIDGEKFDFQIESFSNTYDLLTIGYCKSKHAVIIPTF